MCQEKKVSQGVDLEVYRTCGWNPAKEGYTEQDELNMRYEKVAKEASKEALNVLDSLIKKYEEEFWSP